MSKDEKGVANEVIDDLFTSEISYENVVKDELAARARLQNAVADTIELWISTVKELSPLAKELITTAINDALKR